MKTYKKFIDEFVVSTVLGGIYAYKKLKKRKEKKKKEKEKKFDSDDRVKYDHQKYLERKKSGYFKTKK